MRKFLFTVLCMVVCSIGLNAQNVITNNYDYNSTSVEDVNDDERVTFSTVGLSYYSFDNFENFGLSLANLTPNGFGMDIAFRMNFKKHGNYNSDLGINYSFEAWKKDKMKLLITLAAGPSLRSQDEYNFDDDKYKDKLFVDCYLNGRVTFKYDRFAVTAGYFYWAGKCKFKKGYKADGPAVTLSYCY